ATMRSSDSLAGVAAGAWRLLGQYGGRDQLRRIPGTSDAAAFSGWADLFVRRCRTNQLLSASECERELAVAIEQRRCQIPAEMLLVGFDGLTPAQLALVKILQASGCPVRIATLQHESSPEQHRTFITAGTPDAELRAAAHWARQR